MGHLDGLEGSGTSAKQGTGAYKAWHESVRKSAGWKVLLPVRGDVGQKGRLQPDWRSG